jgi:23S rRNA (adenine2503-C2)-methyltransferase
LELSDRALIETVIIRAPQDGVGIEHSRKTICISTQVGCAMGCAFCASGLDGFRRNLGAGEIVAQLLAVCHQEDARSPRADDEFASFDNIVGMGTGVRSAAGDHFNQRPGSANPAPVARKAGLPSRHQPARRDR